MRLPDNCVYCNSKVIGDYKNVPLTVCCRGCVGAQRNQPCERKISGSPYLIHESAAVETYRSCPEALSLLKSIQAENYVSSNGENVKLFVLAEVLAVYGFLIKIQELLQDKLELEQRFGIDIGLLDVPVRHFLTGDYFSGTLKTNTTFQEVEERCAVVTRVVEIWKECPRVHPEAVFHFCLDHPEAGVVEFRDLREKMQLVFQTIGRKIFEKLPDWCITALDDTVLENDVDDFLSCAMTVTYPVSHSTDGRLSTFHRYKRARFFASIVSRFLCLKSFEKRDDREVEKCESPDQSILDRANHQLMSRRLRSCSRRIICHLSSQEILSILSNTLERVRCSDLTTKKELYDDIYNRQRSKQSSSYNRRIRTHLLNQPPKRYFT